MNRFFRSILAGILILPLLVLPCGCLAEGPCTEDRGVDLTEQVSIHYPAVAGLDLRRAATDGLDRRNHGRRVQLCRMGGRRVENEPEHLWLDRVDGGPEGRAYHHPGRAVYG